MCQKLKRPNYRHHTRPYALHCYLRLRRRWRPSLRYSERSPCSPLRPQSTQYSIQTCPYYTTKGNTILTTIFALLVAFQIKHFVCDFPLQTPYTLGKTKATGWIKPLLAHAGIHASATFLITVMFSIKLAVILALADLVIHFTVDRIKASPSLGGRFNPSQPYFWWALGADQMAHHITHNVFILTIIVNI